MRGTWPAVPLAFLTGASLWALLAAVRPSDPGSGDPWLAAWRRAGLKATLRSVSGDPEERFMIPELRARLAHPEFAGTAIREYLVDDVRVQVLDLPSEDLRLVEGESPMELPGKRTFRHRRSGRHLLVIRGGNRVLFASVAVPRSLQERIEEAFSRAGGGTR